MWNNWGRGYAMTHIKAFTQKKDMDKLDKAYLKEQKKINEELGLLINDALFNRTPLTQYIVQERMCLGMADVCRRISTLNKLDNKQHKDFKKKEREFLGLSKLMKMKQKEVEERWEKIKKTLNQK